MSYSQSFSKRISVDYSGSINYPASEEGGTIEYSGTEYEDVQVNIDVETTAFDNSVAHCNSSVNVLTGAIVATELAQITSINNNAKQVGSTIVEGFFKTIRSEISQQISELSYRIEANLMHLHEMAKRCIEKQRQMESDYNGISNRYLRIFDDLNNELSNRIYELDKPAFIFEKQGEISKTRTSENDLVTTVAVSGAEGGNLLVRISASFAKRRAMDTIGKANTFLIKQKRLYDTINLSMLKDSVAAIQYIPVCLIEMHNEDSQIDRNLYQPQFLPEMRASELIPDFQEKVWNNFSKESINHIHRYFNSEVNNRYSGSDTHTSRVRESISRMLEINQIQTIYI